MRMIKTFLYDRGGAMSSDYIVCLSRLLSLLEEDANEIRKAVQGETAAPYKAMVDRELQATKLEIRNEQMIIWR